MLLVGYRFSETKKNDGTGIFTFQYLVPSESKTSSIEFMAMGRTSDGSLVVRSSNELIVNISLARAGKIVSMRLPGYDLDTPFFFTRIGESLGINVAGKFTDGVERNITSASFGTKYTFYPEHPLNTDIIRIDSSKTETYVRNGEGFITSISPGEGSIRITNKDYSGDPIVVKVIVCGEENCADYFRTHP